MADHGARLVLKDVAKRYGEVVALAPTDLAIDAGEFFSLIGPSGSGKSTLLGAIAGFTPPSQGRIEMDGIDIVGVPPYRRNIGMVFQNYALFPHMDVFENIAFPLRLRKMASPEVKSRVERMLAMVRLPQFGARSIGQLSGGQQQRVALARAAVYDPRILLMDEPLGALDKNLREEMQFEIKEAHRQLGATILYVTHDQDEAASISDRIAIMRNGHVVQTGSPRELYEHPRNAFVASFLGDANLLEIARFAPAGGDRLCGQLHNGTVLGLAASERDAPVADAVLACVRPEAVSLRHDGEAVPEGHNRLSGTVTDAVFMSGVRRYRVEVGAGKPMLVRDATARRAEMPEIGRPVTLSWPIEQTQLIPKE
ncbi:MAG: ABC transporter ATP-binding protein [Hyphomicrobiales bacterium]